MSLQDLQRRIAPLRQSLLEHPLYADLERPAALRQFMQLHVFAVWDFMSLLKTLQRRISSVSVPWLPGEHSSEARLINEIVLAEESDEDGRGGFASHFELYHRAMRRFGADTSQLDRFIARLRAGDSLAEAIARAELAEPVRRFVGHTFAVIERGNLCEIAAAFTFGREDLLPDVFRRIVERLHGESQGEPGRFQVLSRPAHRPGWRRAWADGQPPGEHALRQRSGPLASGRKRGGRVPGGPAGILGRHPRGDPRPIDAALRRTRARRSGCDTAVKRSRACRPAPHLSPLARSSGRPVQRGMPGTSMSNRSSARAAVKSTRSAIVVGRV